MVDGFLLFTVLDVWRMVLPLGLTLLFLMTDLLCRWQSDPPHKGLRDLLSPLVFRTAPAAGQSADTAQRRVGRADSRLPGRSGTG